MNRMTHGIEGASKKIYRKDGGSMILIMEMTIKVSMAIIGMYSARLYITSSQKMQQYKTAGQGH